VPEAFKREVNKYEVNKRGVNGNLKKVTTEDGADEGKQVEHDNACRKCDSKFATGGEAASKENVAAMKGTGCHQRPHCMCICVHP
jgi:hypothetical protein